MSENCIGPRCANCLIKNLGYHEEVKQFNCTINGVIEVGIEADNRRALMQARKDQVYAYSTTRCLNPAGPVSIENVS